MDLQLRPRIGITMRLELETNRFYLARHYSEAVEAAGRIPVHIALIPPPDFIKQMVAGPEGPLLPGSKSTLTPLPLGTEPRPEPRNDYPPKHETDLLPLTTAG